MMAYDARIDTECNKLEEQKYEINKKNLLFLAIETRMHLLSSPSLLPATKTAQPKLKNQNSFLWCQNAGSSTDLGPSTRTTLINVHEVLGSFLIDAI